VAVPLVEQDQFEFMDLPFVHKGGIQELRAFWEKHAAERDQWMHDAYRDFLP
jgi:hypothetical protein